MDLIKIENVEGKKTVNARSLWKFLESKQEFSNWIKARTLRFIEDRDFLIRLSESNGGRPSKEYHLTIETGKMISMLENNEKGDEIREYFLECEKKMKGEVVSMSPAELILKMAQQSLEQEKQISEIKTSISVIEAKLKTTQNDYFTVVGYCSLKGLKVTATMANAYGRKCAKFSREFDYRIDKINDPRFGQVNTYHVDVLNENIP